MSKINFFLLLLTLMFSVRGKETDCSTYDSLFACPSEKETDIPSSLFSSFQTPPREQAQWKESYEDYSILTGYVRTEYPKDQSKAKLTFISNFNNKEPS